MKKFTPIPRKYKNLKVNYDGKTFDSAKEAERYKILKSYVELGLIARLRTQVTFYLSEQGKRDPEGKAIRPIKYVADFVYEKDGKTVVEDVKGYRNPADAAYRIFRMKQKLMYDRYGIWVKEI